MKKLIIMLTALFSFGLIADEIPFALIKSSETDPNNLSEIPLKDNPSKINKQGEKVRKVQNLNSSCFKPNMTDKDLQELTEKIQKKYKNISFNDIQTKYASWKKYQDDLNYVEEKPYNNPNLPDYFDKMKKDPSNESLYLGTLDADGCGNLGYNSKTKKVETIDEQLTRCSSYDDKNNPKRQNVLYCGLEFSCVQPEPTTTTPKTEEILETTTITCEANETFVSDKTDINDLTDIEKCLKSIPQEALNIVVTAESCSTLVKRKKGTNEELTKERQEKMVELVGKKLADLGFARDKYTIVTEVDNDNENYYYNPQTKELKGTGTCGDRAFVKRENRKDYLYNEQWAIDYFQKTKDYIESHANASIIKDNASHFSWIYNDTEITDQNTDGAMAKFRYNKLTVNYDLKKIRPVEQPVDNYSSIIVRTPKIICLYIKGTPEPDGGIYKRKTGGKTTPKGKKKLKNKKMKGAKPIGCPPGMGS